MVVALFKGDERFFSHAMFVASSAFDAIEVMREAMTRDLRGYRSLRTFAICGHSNGCNSR